MARSRSKSTLATMRAVSTVLFLAVAGLVAVGIDQMRHWNILTGWELIGWALIPLALLLSFTLPVMCKVVRTNGLACNHWAYGLLFGCGKVPGHRWKKFRAPTPRTLGVSIVPGCYCLCVPCRSLSLFFVMM